ncbi:hypothetical protein DPMN_047053 [Dreissena polymorpha]|uniref:Uncharacterized protein n=1 Tax=Dreissena polymorpha TaxID=45954 RepID=A0A9D4I157_DREPO|nr:hypothetical protein DPMN_047053 [Dreissena polymorpha]
MCSGSLDVDLCMVVYSMWYVIVVHLSGAEEEVSVGYLRSSVSREGLYIVAVPRSQNTPPPHKRTHAERARAPPRARIRPRPEHPTAEDPRDKHPHPPSRCARQQISQEPTMEPPQSPTRSHHRSFPPTCQTSRPCIKLGCIYFVVMLYLLL